ncbi:MAG: hypothetical protein ABEJ65_02755 [bacterium]
MNFTVSLDKQWGFFLLGLVLVLLWGVALLHPVGSGVHRVVDNGDAYLHSWNLWWVNHAVTSFNDPYRTDFNGYPDTISLTYHQLILPLGIFSIPLFAVGMYANQVLLFWSYAFLVVGFSGMYCLADRLRAPPLGALVGGLYFVVVPIYWQNIPRPDSLSYVLFPWILLAFLWAQRGSVYRMILPVVLTGLVFLLSPYMAACIILAWLFVMPVYYLFGFRLRRLVLLVPGALIVSSFQWGPQVFGNRPNLVDFRVVEAYGADVTSWLLPSSKAWWMWGMTPWWKQAWTATEPSLYLGWFAVGFLIVNYSMFSRIIRRWGLTVSVLFGILSLGPSLRFLGESYLSGFMPYAWGMYLFDSVRALRAPLRFGYPLFFLVALGMAYVFPAKGWKRYILGAVIIAEMLRVPVQVKPLPDPNSLQQVRSEIDRPALVPVPLTDWATEVQYGQTIHKKKMAMMGLSYGREKLWGRVAQNPVLHALYQRKPLPEKGWKTLRNQGYGGVLVHKKMFPERMQPRLEKWRDTLKKKWGKPVINTGRVILYKFNAPK